MDWLRPFEFEKLSAAGNDFACIDNLDGRFDALINTPASIARFAHAFCLRGPGVGADGVIFACQPEIDHNTHASARIFEWDGSEVELCGNGTASFTCWAINHGLLPDEADALNILTPAGIVQGKRVEGDYIRVCVPLPIDVQRNFELVAAGQPLHCDFAITGIPHVVTYVDDIDSVDVSTLGYALRHHERFQPRGANANFVQYIAEGEIALRTFEFGVEGETLACGTGSASSAILAARHFGWGEPYTSDEKPVLVHTHGGKVLRVHFTIDGDDHVSDLCLDSPVQTLYRAITSSDLLQALADACAIV
jgi:diaminopimelate epimerase